MPNLSMHKMKTLIILYILLIISVTSYSQLTLSNLTKYIRLDYDYLDENLSKQGFRFYRENSVEGQQAYLWLHSKNGNGFSIIVQQDTISIRSEGTYAGYSKVNKFALNYITYNFPFYNSILAEIKKSLMFKKVVSGIKGTAIITEYENDDFYIDFTKDNSNKRTIYYIKVIDKSYEIVDATMNDGEIIKHSKKECCHLLIDNSYGCR